MKGGPAGHIGGSRGVGKLCQVEGGLEGAVGVGGGDGASRCGGRGLAAGHGVDHVVDADHLEVDIAPGCVDEVIAADGGEVAIARVHYHLQRWVGELQSSGERNGAAVRGVERIELRVAGYTPGTADSRDYGDLVEVGLGFEQRAREAVDGGSDAAAGTPDVGHAVHAEEGLDGIGGLGLNGDGAHRDASRMAARICSGWCTLPPAWVTGMTRGLRTDRPGGLSHTARSTSWTI